MDKLHDNDLDLRSVATVGQLMDRLRSISLPVVIIPLDVDHKPMESGRACTTEDEFLGIMTWAYHTTPCRLVRLVPVMRDDQRQP